MVREKRTRDENMSDTYDGLTGVANCGGEGNLWNK